MPSADLSRERMDIIQAASSIRCHTTTQSLSRASLSSLFFRVTTQALFTCYLHCSYFGLSFSRARLSAPSPQSVSSECTILSQPSTSSVSLTSVKWLMRRRCESLLLLLHPYLQVPSVSRARAALLTPWVVLHLVEISPADLGTRRARRGDGEALQ